MNFIRKDQPLPDHRSPRIHEGVWVDDRWLTTICGAWVRPDQAIRKTQPTTCALCLAMKRKKGEAYIQRMIDMGMTVRREKNSEALGATEVAKTESGLGPPVAGHHR